MKDFKSLLDLNKIPAHVAIIMDGNGRWAEKRSLSRLEGHRMGAEVIRPIVDASISIGIKVITLFAFSTENWSRPKKEVTGLWNLLEFYFKSQWDSIMENGIRITISGETKRLPHSTKMIIDYITGNSRHNKKLILNLCLNYGGRMEIVDAINKWTEKRKENELMTLKKMSNYFYIPNLPDIDLMIRTSGEYRISNFMLWQLAYSELVFLKVLWPDFKPHHMFKAIYEFQKRERRFGAI